jgi:hypothetical protein
MEVVLQVSVSLREALDAILMDLDSNHPQRDKKYQRTLYRSGNE